MATNITTYLLASLSMDNSVRKQAEFDLKQFEERHFGGYILSLAREISSDGKPLGSRSLAGLVLKNTLDSKEESGHPRWLMIEAPIKEQIKTCLQQTLIAPLPGAQLRVSEITAKIASIEPTLLKEWPEFIESLIASLLGEFEALPVYDQQVTWETLGSLFKEVSPDIFKQEQRDLILEAVVQSIGKTELDYWVKLAAINALNSALGFAQATFKDDRKRQNIIHVLCKATRAPDVDIPKAAYECLTAITSTSTYYKKIARYFEFIWRSVCRSLTFVDDVTLAIEAMKLFSLICRMEKEYGAIEKEYRATYPGMTFERRLSEFLGMVLIFFHRENQHENQHENPEEEQEGVYNFMMAAATCLGVVAETVPDKIVKCIDPYFRKHTTYNDWRSRDLAIFGFGSILEGASPDKSLTVLEFALFSMLGLLTDDPNINVKERAGWGLAKVFKFLHNSDMGKCYINTYSNYIATVLMRGMEDVPGIAEKACCALYFLVKGFEGSSCPLTPRVEEIMQALVTMKAREHHLSTAADETLNEVMRFV